MTKEEYGIKVALDENAYLPERAYESDAGFDLRTPYPVYVKAGSSAIIDTGVHVEIPAGYYGKLESKSGLNTNHNVVSLGGVIDSGYTGSIVAKLYNVGDKDYVFKKGDKIVQLIIQPCISWLCRMQEVSLSELNGGKRGNNGFGSTGR